MAAQEDETMSYENAPATRLLATNCGCCGRQLVDAVSVEAGIGPECRKKHGYNQSEGACDSLAVTKALGTLPTDSRLPALPATAIEPWLNGDAHKVANILVQHIAVDPHGPMAAPYVAAVRALGYTKLATALAKHLGGIRVEQVGETYEVRAPYNPVFGGNLRRISGYFDRATKSWRVPTRNRQMLWTFMQEAFPAGTLVMSATGAKVL
jgi:hypothetical protein